VQNGDAARVAAAAATGVGFLGAGVITTSNGIVSGLTTAASIWMAAALGVAAGAGLSLFVAMATGCAMVVLRMPRRAVGRRAARDFERDSIPPKDVEPDP
jgi:putative Mg2+ transporter-C (MgtC) family protein